MENLSEERTRKKSTEKKKEEEKEEKNVLLRRESTFENYKDDSESDKLKQSRLPKYTKSNLLIKSMKISLLNWKFCLFARVKSIFFDILDISIPMQKGIIIDCITDKSKHNLLYPNFIKIVKFILLKLVFQIIFQLVQIYYIVFLVSLYY